MTLYNYDEVGNLEDFIYPNGVSHSYEYDGLNRLTNQVLALLGTPFETYAYKLAPTGHRLQVREGNGRLVNYQYDNIYRLTKESILFSSIVGDIDYGLDPVGNRLNMSSTVLGIPSQVNTFDDNDRLDSDTYDANGNTVSAAVPGGTATDTYDFENRLTNRVVGADTISIVYDGDGNRVTKTVNGVTRHFLVDDNNLTGFAQVFEELDGALSVDVVYTYGHDLISQERAGATNFVAHFYGYDGHGNVRLLTDSAGTITDRYDYDAFGNLIASSGTTLNNYLYTGEQFDPEFGMYFLRARYMDTTRGRFWSMDTFEGVLNDPFTLHKYLYANADPVNNIDPSGQITLGELLQASAISASLSATLSVAIVKVTNPDADSTDLIIAAVTGGVGGAIAPINPYAGAFTGGFLASFIGAKRKGCTNAEATYIATVGGLIASGLPLAVAVRTPAFGEIFSSVGGGLLVGFVTGSTQAAADEFFGLFCLRQNN